MKHRASAVALGALMMFALAITPRAEVPPATVYDEVVQQYMSAKWEDLEKTLQSKAKELAALTGQQKADLAYIRASLLETRPAWWNQTKTATQKFAIRPVLWGRPLPVTYDPAGKSSVQTSYTGGKVDVTVFWPAADMDNPAHAEHGFSKGELGNLGVFATLGMANAYATVPPQSLVNLSEDQKTQLLRYFEFEGDLAGVYHGTPRARQWGIWLYLHSYLDKYARMPIVNSRKAIAVAFLSEILANPKKYPSIKLPDHLDAENAEEKLALEVHKPLEKKWLTLAEDRSIREMLQKLAAANEGVLKSGSIVKFANGLTMSLDPEKDAPLRNRRDAWFKKQFDTGIAK